MGCAWGRAAFGGAAACAADVRGTWATPTGLVLAEVSGDGRRVTQAIPATLGSPSAPLTPTQMAAKLALARELASPTCDPRIFDNPLAYFTDPT